MNSVLDQVINYSNGKWVHVADIRRDIDLSNYRHNPLSRLENFGDVVLDTKENLEGEVIMYRAYRQKGRSVFDLARLRKYNGGFMGAPESFPLRRAAA